MHPGGEGTSPESFRFRGSKTDMATLALAAAGAAAGSALLPSGLTVLGATIGGATIGAQVEFPHGEGRVSVNGARATLWGDYSVRTAFARKDRRERRAELNAGREAALRRIAANMANLDARQFAEIDR